MNSNEIKIVGVGDGGLNVLISILSNAIKNIEYIACNTDIKSFNKQLLQHKIQLGIEINKGADTNGNAELGRLAALKSEDKLEQLFDENSKMAILVTALGGGTGTGATPVIAQIAKKRGLFTIAIAFIPFEFEGEKRYRLAQQGVAELQKQTDFVVVIDNNKILQAYGNIGFKAGFEKPNRAVGQFIKMLIKIASSEIDNTEIKKLVQKIQKAKAIFFGFGEAEGQFRDRKVIENALKNALSEREDIDGVQNVFLHIGFGNREISVHEIAQINETAVQNTANNTNITLLVEQDCSLGDSLSVVVLAS
jgi:cell division protein FtsZ